MNARTGQHMKRGALASGVAIAAAVALFVYAGSNGVKTPAQAKAAAAPPPPTPVTATIEKKQLVERLVTRGTVASADALQYTPPTGSGGTARLEVLREPGETVNSGDVAALVDGRPVFLLQGERQLGADIRPDSTGRDVDLLQAALRNNGATIPESENGTVGKATQDAITALYQTGGIRRSTTAEPAGGNGGSGAGGESLELRLSRLRRAVADAQYNLHAATTAANAQTNPAESARLGVAGAERKVAEARAASDASVADALSELEAARTALNTAQAAASTTTTTTQPGELPGVGSGSGPVQDVASLQTQVRSAEKALRDTQRQGETAIADAFAQLASAQQQLADAQKGVVSSTASADQQVATAKSALDAANEVLSEAARRDGVTLPRAEVLFVPKLPTTVLTVGDPNAQAGFGGSGSSVLFTLRSGDFVVNIDVPTGVTIRDGAAGVAEADNGDVVLNIEGTPAGGNPPDPGTTAGTPGAPPVDAASQGASSLGGPAQGPTSFKITGAIKGAAVAGANLRVTITTPVTAEEVLTVPLRAVQTRSNGDSYLRVVSGSKTEEVTVRVGRSGSGFVELTGTTGIEAGDKVLLE